MTTSSTEPIEFKDLLKKNQDMAKDLTKEYESNSKIFNFLHSLSL
jgi:hypothetical protein